MQLHKPGYGGESDQRQMANKNEKRIEMQTWTARNK